MAGTKYLSEVVKIDDLRKNALNVIKAPTGCGKTYFALSEIPSHCDNAFHQAVYLIDTANGRDQIIRNYNASAINWEWVQIVRDDGRWFKDDNRIAIMTYHKFGMLIEEDLDFYNKFDYIVCDELHNLIHYMTYDNPRHCRLAWSGIQKAVQNSRTTVIALTATPTAIWENLVRRDEPIKYYEVPINSSELRHYDVKHKERFTNAREVLKNQSIAQTGILYTQRVRNQIAYADFAKELGFSPICIWSLNNQDHPMNDEQLEARRSIVEEAEIPQQYNLLIINKASETSIKIRSPVHYMIICDSSNEIQIQVKGRVSNDLDALYLPLREYCDLVVPDRFLNVALSSDDKHELLEALNIRNEQGRLYGWGPKSKQLIVNAGYTISDSFRIAGDNRRYAIILPTK